MGCKVKFVILIFFKKSLREEKVFKIFHKPGVSLEPSQISTMELFLRKLTTFSSYLFSQKSSIEDVQLGSKYASANVF